MPQVYAILGAGDRVATGTFDFLMPGIIKGPEGMTRETAQEWRYVGGEWVHDPIVPSLENEQGLVVERIKREAAEQIEALAWRIERAEERDKIGAEGETVGEVLREREAIRRASNRAEAEVNALESIAEVQGYDWAVLPEDWPANTTMTRLQFMRRFTDDERAAIRAARDSGQSQDLLDFWELLKVATSVNINDQDIQLGVGMLEQVGLIGTGRSTEVLTVQN